MTYEVQISRAYRLNGTSSQEIGDVTPRYAPMFLRISPGVVDFLDPSLLLFLSPVLPETQHEAWISHPPREPHRAMSHIVTFADPDITIIKELG